MFFRDSLPAEIGSPLASCLLFFLVSQADNEGVVLLSYADIAKVFACSKARVQRLVQLLSAKHLVDTVMIRSRYKKSGLMVCDIARYKRPQYDGDTMTIWSHPSAPAPKKEKPSSPKPADDIERRAAAFIAKVNAFKDKYSSKMLDNFCQYWTEHNEHGSKMRYEKEPTFDIGRRLSRWSRTDFKHSNNTSLGVVVQDTQKKDYEQSLW